MSEDYGISDSALEQRIAELSDHDFDRLVARTRPPRVDPQDITASIRAKLAQMYKGGA